MKKILIAVVVIAVVGAGVYFGLGKMRPAAVAAASPAVAQEPVKAGNRVAAEAKVMPVRNASLSFTTSGTVAEVLVAEGAQVTAGQPLVRLHAEQRAAAVAGAQADVQRAQARLDELKAGPRAEEIAVAKAGVEAAEAQRNKLTQDARPEDVAAAQAGLAAARADLAKVQEGPSDPQVTAAAAELANAEAALRQAQSAYDRIKSNPDAGAYPQALQLEQATNAYNVARARYQDLTKGATAADLAKAQAGVQKAGADVEKAKAPARPADVAAADAEVRRAQAELDLRTAGTRPEQIAAAEADLAAATAALARAQADLSDAELLAPFAGTVAALDVVVGEPVGSSTVVAQLADLSAWQLETTDLTELNVVRIREGDPATINFDAHPGKELKGNVSRIKPLGENRQGDIVYTVTITADEPDWAGALAAGQLRWNMTAAVTIEPKP